jgi:Domain of unknown function (DUF4337)
MNTDPLEIIDSGKETDSFADQKSHLNTWVALAVALLATFMGVCKVKDDNIVQAMQQAQADRLDHWSYYQARVNREEIAKSTVTLLKLNNADHKADEAIKAYEARAQDLENKKEELKKQAESDQKKYDDLNYRDDQFDLSDALLAIAIAMLAVTSLTSKRWLFIAALVPTLFGVIMGIAGLVGWQIHPDGLIHLLS